MGRPLHKLQRFFRELKRRNVYQVAATYAVVGFVLIQLADLTFVRLGLPSWTVTFLIVLVAMGFPLALVLAWAFERTPEGVRRTREGEPVEEGASEAGEGRTAGYKLLVGLGLVAAAVAGGWYLTGGGGEVDVTDRSIAVLPFENMGGEESVQFTQGVHDGLLTRLSNVSALKVTSRTSVMRYEDTQMTLPEIARELEVAWVVEGAVQQAGGQVQVNTQLIRAGDDDHQWARTYQRELTPENFFAIQGELTKEIARSLKAELSPEESERVERHPTRDLEAYRLYVQGRREFGRRTLESVQEAVKHFRGAVERDSSFALAWSGLADAAGLLSEASDSVVAPEVSQEVAARRALELEPDLAEAHASMGFFHMENMDAPAARRALERALELKPSYWEAHHWLGELYFRIGREQEALEHLRLAVELNPEHRYARHWLMDIYNSTGQHEKSLEQARLRQRRGEPGWAAAGGEVRALMQLERYDEARAVARDQVEELGPRSLWGGWFRAYLVRILAAQGDTAGAREYLDELRAADADPRMLASASFRLGDSDRALQWLARLEGKDWSEPASIGLLRDFGEVRPELRENPRYRELMAEAYRAWGLEPDGSFPSEAQSDA